MSDGPASSSPSPEAPDRPTRPRRRLLGGDIFLTEFPDRPDELLVDSGFAVDGWAPPPPRHPHQAPFPGSSLRIGEDWWEVRAVEERHGPLGDDRVVYRLGPWPSGATLRQPEELDATRADRLTESHRATRAHAREAQQLGMLLPLVGMLPASVQQEIDSRYGFEPGRATIMTAAPLLAISAYFVTIFIAGGFAGGMAGGAKVPGALADHWNLFFLYLFLESAVRLAQGIRGQPMGVALFVIPHTLLVTTRSTPAEGEALPTAVRPAPLDVQKWLEAEDVVRPLAAKAGEVAAGSLEILSPLPKEHWRANVDAIVVDGTSYVLVDRREVPGGHRFVLEPAVGSRLFRHVHTYHPTEVREVYKARKRLSADAWVESLAPLVGLTPPGLQLDLAEIYRYRPYRASGQSVLLTAVFGALAVRAGLSHGPGGGGLDHMLGVLLGVALLWESAVRGWRLTSGQLTASFLGGLVAPFARRALRWRPATTWTPPDGGLEHGMGPGPAEDEAGTAPTDVYDGPPVGGEPIEADGEDAGDVGSDRERG